MRPFVSSFSVVSTIALSQQRHKGECHCERLRCLSFPLTLALICYDARCNGIMLHAEFCTGGTSRVVVILRNGLPALRWDLLCVDSLNWLRFRRGQVCGL
jgi:hypothetical protein